MRRVLFMLLAAVIAAPVASSAQSFADAGPAAVPTAPVPATPPVPVAEMVATAPSQAETVKESRVAVDVRDDRQFAQRGSFWWLVGVVVVAGVILAILL